MRILLVEDDVDLGLGLRNNLEIEGYVVHVATDGLAGLAALSERQFELVILDLMLPGADGIRVLQTMRSRRDSTPVLILTARGQEKDKVRGLKLGADDYVTKPFGVLELLARVEALLRRTSDAPPAPTALQFGDVIVDSASKQVHRRGVQVSVTPKEFELLWALLLADGATVSRRALMEDVWGYRASVLSRTVDTHVSELRRKLEADPSSPRHLLTVHKLGYRLAR